MVKVRFFQGCIDHGRKVKLMNVENQRNSSALRNPTDRKSVNIQRNERFRFKGPIFPSFYGGDTYQLFTKRDTWGDFQIQLVVRARLELTRFSCKPSAVTTRSQWVFRNWNYFLSYLWRNPRHQIFRHCLKRYFHICSHCVCQVSSFLRKETQSLVLIKQQRRLISETHFEHKPAAG